MIEDPSFSQVMLRLRAGDAGAADQVFRRFVHRLIGLASRKFDAQFRSKEDPEDVVLSVYKSFFRRDGKRPYNLEDWEGLWALLATITVRKCLDRGRYWRANCRDVEREAVPGPVLSEQGHWQEAIARGPTPEQALVLTETLERLVLRLEPHQRKIAELCFQDYPCVEIADRCGCSERTVRRVLERIRLQLGEIEA